jgi:hypothetical protein
VEPACGPRALRLELTAVMHENVQVFDVSGEADRREVRLRRTILQISRRRSGPTSIGCGGVGAPEPLAVAEPRPPRSQCLLDATPQLAHSNPALRCLRATAGVAATHPIRVWWPRDVFSISVRSIPAPGRRPLATANVSLVRIDPSDRHDTRTHLSHDPVRTVRRCAHVHRFIVGTGLDLTAQVLSS